MGQARSTLPSLLLSASILTSSQTNLLLIVHVRGQLRLLEGGRELRSSTCIAGGQSLPALGLQLYPKAQPVSLRYLC